MSEESKQNYLLIATAVILVLLAAFFLIRTPADSPSSILGTVNFTNLKPNDSTPNDGKIILLQRELIQGENTKFTDTGINIQVKDNSEWVWDSAIEGKTYELRADLYWEDQLIKPSNVITTSAPAAGQVLVLDVTLNDIPENILDQTQVPISGDLELNGYIPEKSFVQIYQKERGVGQFELVLDNLPAKDKTKWVWEDAIPNKSYEIKGVLVSDTSNIGESSTLLVTAPVNDVSMSINSVANAPGAIISGEVKINGAVVNDSSIVMFQSLAGVDSFTEFQRLTAIDGVEFNWGNALSGESYEIKAEYQVKGEKEATSNTVVSTAPISGLQLLLDTKLVLNSPKESPRVSCKEKDSEGNYEASITYPRIKDAKRYYVQIGTGNDNNDIYKSVINNTNPNEDVKVSVKVAEGENRYTSYSYTYCSNCDTTDVQNWSALSPVTEFQCPSAE